MKRLSIALTCLVAIGGFLLATRAVVRAELSAESIQEIADMVSELDSHVTWSSEKKLEGNGDLIVITAIGESPLFEKLKEINGKETSEGRTLKFRLVEPDWMPANSHVLIFSGLEAEKTRKLISLVNGRGSLCITLGEG
ncbi:hypothetical protein GF377_00825, partial [candidate division GN15 bacterium]|nr:hypothetical protein [candidate division GN15 bacterium]